MSSSMVGYVATNMLGLWVALILAGRVTGGVASYQYAFVFFQLPHGLIAVSIATAIFPAMTEKAVAGNDEDFAKELARGLRGGGLLRASCGRRIHRHRPTDCRPPAGARGDDRGVHRDGLDGA